MEIEIRAKIDNIKNIEQSVIKLGAKLLKQKKQIDKYFGEISAAAESSAERFCRSVKLITNFYKLWDSK
ncbi:hypothetical protein KKC83_06805 [Patescibacteria group bacterium]|nr:hypothetical protein [Candidatus Falkowbacteria bacterium]MBU3905830.1 hypothetical protein [Patescibacteria group bacterium]MBU4015173.1 hypothetical protein [Patescibacteria group bacterium]MBU4027223.1 hypothetical protein [Patescibacteria group bacterium]MBU4073402.1 hypothetical protein [Patescibacteria group bacterium]